MNNTQQRIHCCKGILSTKNEEIGEILLVDYNTHILHIEYKIYDEFAHYRNKGIMTMALADYLKFAKKNKYTRLLATVKKDNIASRRVLEKNNFIKFQEKTTYYVYLIDLNLSATFTEKTIIQFFKNYDKSLEQ